MSSTGSIIQLHQHINFPLLEFLTEDNNNLYYKDKPIYTPISKLANNLIEEKEDGFFVNGATLPDEIQHNILTRFSTLNGVLYFDGIVVSREYERQSIQLMVQQLWTVINSGGVI